MKIKLLFKASVFAFAFFACTNSYAQSNNWQQQNNENGIEVYSQIISCEVQGFSTPVDYVVFKIVNTTSVKSLLNLQFEIYFEEGCNGCDGSKETSTQISLNPGESIEASCSNLENNLAYFILNPSFKDSWHYTQSKVLIQLTK